MHSRRAHSPAAGTCWWSSGRQHEYNRSRGKECSLYRAGCCKVEVHGPLLSGWLWEALSRDGATAVKLHCAFGQARHQTIAKSMTTYSVLLIDPHSNLQSVRKRQCFRASKDVDPASETPSAERSCEDPPQAVQVTVPHAIEAWYWLRPALL